MQPADAIHGLYAITPECTDTPHLCAMTRQALAGGAKIVQYRAKTLSPSTQLQQALALLALCRSYSIPLLINDNVGLAAQIDADGVHIGEHDAALTTARKTLGRQKIIGVSCYNQLPLAVQAAEQGADYVAFGSMYPSGTKPAAVPASLGLLQTARSQLNCPIVAIGGITHLNAAPLIQAGADAVAVISDLFDAPDIEMRAQQFTQLFV